MRDTIKKLLVKILIPVLFVAFTLPGTGSIDAHAMGSDGKTVNVKIIDNNVMTVYAKKIYATTIIANPGQSGYCIDLQITNKLEQPIYVEMCVNKINGKAVSYPFQAFYNTGNAQNTYVRVNSKATVTRTANIPFSHYGQLGISHISLLKGYFRAMDLSMNPVAQTPGSNLYTFKTDAEEAIQGPDDEGAAFIANIDAADDENDLITTGSFKMSLINVLGSTSYWNVENKTGQTVHARVTVKRDDANETLADTYYMADGTVEGNYSTYFSYSGFSNFTESDTYKSLNGQKKIDLLLTLYDFNGNVLATKDIDGVDLSGVYVNTSSTSGYNYSINGPTTVYYGQNPTYSLFTMNTASMPVINEDVKWSSGDEKVGSIDEQGRFDPHDPGVTVITAEYAGQKMVTAVEVKDPELNIIDMVVRENAYAYFSYSLNPYFGEEDPEFELTSSDTSIVEISADKRYLIGKKEGVATITAKYTTGSGITYEAQSQVRVYPFTGFKTYTKNKTLYYNGTPGDNQSFMSVYTIDDRSPVTFSVEVSDESVLSVTPYYGMYPELEITPLKIGTADVTLKYGSYSYTCKFTVKSSSDYVEEEENTTVPDVERNVKNPNIASNQVVYRNVDENNRTNLEIKLSETGYDEEGYFIEYDITNNTGMYQSINHEFKSVNNILFKTHGIAYNQYFSGIQTNVAPGNTKTRCHIRTGLLSRLNTTAIEEISGLFRIYGQFNTTASYQVKAGEQATYTLDRGGFTKLINDDCVDVDIAEIVESSVNKNATVTVYVKNTSVTDTIGLDMFVDEINGEAVSENIGWVLDNSMDSVLKPNEQLIAYFHIPAKTFKSIGKKINSIKLDAAVRIKGENTNQSYSVSKILDAKDVKTSSQVLAISGMRKLYVGEDPYTLSVYESDSYGNIKYALDQSTFTWESSNTDVAVVSEEGKVYPVGEGSALITASDGTRMATTTLEVKGPTIETSTYYSNGVIEGCYAEAYDFYTIHPYSGIKRDTLKVESANKDIVDLIDGYYLLGKHPGNTTVTVSCTMKDGTELSKDIEVTVNPITGVKLSTDVISMDANDSYRPLTLYANGYNRFHQVEWSVEDESVAKVISLYDAYEDLNEDGGYTKDYTGGIAVVPVAPGETYVTARFGSYTAECAIIVNEAHEVDEDEDDTDENPEVVPGQETEVTPNPINQNNETAIDPASEGANDSAAQNDKEKDNTTPAVGEPLVDKRSGASYVVTPDGGVQFTSNNNPKATTITVPDTVTINGVTYPVTSVSANAFKNNKQITKVTVGKNVTKIESSAFQGATNLRNVNLTNAKVEVIQKNAFKNCPKLTSIKLNANTLKKVEKGAFKGLKKNIKVTVYAKSKAAFDKNVKKLQKAGLTSANFKFKKKKK